ncbi:uncharacterized protein LOC144715352 isoform X2 [Wolffia australiana]
MAFKEAAAVGILGENLMSRKFRIRREQDFTTRRRSCPFSGPPSFKSTRTNPLLYYHHHHHNHHHHHHPSNVIFESSMGCVSSAQAQGDRRRLKKLGDVAVFFPGIRLPCNVDFTLLLRHGVSQSLVDRLSNLRARAAAMVAQEASSALKFTARTVKNQGGGFGQESALRGLEEYLPVLLGLLRDGLEIADKVQFSWVNLVDDADETTMGNAWYEVLSVLHLMAMLSLLHANQLLIPIRSKVGDLQQKIIQENRRICVDICLKAAGYLDFAVQHVLPRLPSQLRDEIPLDIAEEMLRALCQQALGEGVEVQLEMAIDSPKATLAVKRRFACEMAIYWNQALEILMKTSSSSADGWGLKEQLYLEWKHVEAKAAAYYYHALVLKEKSEDKSLGSAVAALRTSELLLHESRRACEAFNSAPPQSRTLPPLSYVESLDEKITRDAARASRISLSFQVTGKCEEAPPLPEFLPSLTPEEFDLPEADAAWEDYKPRSADHPWKELQ